MSTTQRLVFFLACLGMLCLSGPPSAAAQPAETPSGPSKTELLWPTGAPGAVGEADADKPSLAFWPAPPDKTAGAAVVICPGGGYGGLAMDHEGKQVAQWLNSFGVSAFVLKYRLAPRYHQPAPLQDAQRALRIVRGRVKEWNVDAGRIGILGFSAGGHLASSAGTHFDNGDAGAADAVDRASCRPDFQVLIYPVISMEPPVTHMGSRTNLLGRNPDAKLVDLYSNDKQVTKDTPPAFLVHTTNDPAVPVENSLLFYQALRKAGVPGEMHIYASGPHGFGLGGRDVVLSTWPGLCEKWMTARGLLKK